MKGRFFYLVLFFALFTIGSELFAFGRRETVEEVTPLNPQWTLCITSFDVSAMPPAWHTAGDLASRNLVSALQNLGFRFRHEEEIGFYQDYALARARSDAANALAARRTERDLLIFRGDPQWRYERNLKSIDDAILVLEERIKEIDDFIPVIEGQPVFLLCENNRNGIFPAPPSPGGELRFCVSNRIDAFLTGSFSEFHGRVFLDIKMYTRYTRSFSYEDSALFSSDDFNVVLTEVSGRLATAVSVTMPSAIIVHADPPETMILIDGSFIGREETRTFSPGTVEVSAFAENHVPVSVSVDLNAGELAEVFFNLTPFALSAFEVNVPGSPGAKVFTGSLYMGEAPLRLELPTGEYSYISVETPEEEIGAGVFRYNNLVRGNVQFAQMETGAGRADFFTGIPAHKEDQRVENARRNFYRTWGAFWIVLPVSMLVSGIASNYIASNDRVIAGNLHLDDPQMRQQISDRAAFASVVTTGTQALIGAALGATFFNVFRYLWVSSGDATPIVRAPTPPEPEEEEEEEDDDEAEEEEELSPEAEAEMEMEMEMEP